VNGRCRKGWSEVMTNYFLGVDIGNTKSHALISDEQGNVLGFSKAGCGNHEIIGYELFADLIQLLVGDALTSAGISSQAVKAAGFGIAGYDWPSQYEALYKGIQLIDLGGPLAMVNDTVIGLVAGAPQGWGIGLVAGTGSNCWGMDQKGRFGRMTGLTHLMDEGGGAGSLVLWAVQAIGRAWTMRGPSTKLTDIFLAHYGEAEVIHLLERLGNQGEQIDASLAPLVIETAHKGDTVALEIIQRAAESLSSLCVGVARQLDLIGQEVDVVLIGSVFKAGRIFIDPLNKYIHAEMPLATLNRLDCPPVVGGVLLAMKEAGYQPKPDTIMKLKKVTLDRVALLDPSG
jgi:N-acetylglucosamine kinase-like BadF-type ATPase